MTSPEMGSTFGCAVNVGQVSWGEQQRFSQRPRTLQEYLLTLALKVVDADCSKTVGIHLIGKGIFLEREQVAEKMHDVGVGRRAKGARQQPAKIVFSPKFLKMNRRSSVRIIGVCVAILSNQSLPGPPLANKFLGPNVLVCEALADVSPIQEKRVRKAYS